MPQHILRDFEVLNPFLKATCVVCRLFLSLYVNLYVELLAAKPRTSCFELQFVQLLVVSVRSATFM